MTDAGIEDPQVILHQVGEGRAVEVEAQREVEAGNRKTEMLSIALPRDRVDPVLAAKLVERAHR